MDGFEALLACLGTIQHGKVLVCGIKGKAVRRLLCPSVGDACRTARFFEKEGYDVFYGPNPRKGTGGREHLTGVVCLHADLDRGEPVLGETLPQPSAVVRSGRGFHLYWRLESPCCAADAERANKGIARALGADSCWDASRVLRVPGSTNKKPGGPYPVVLEHVSDERYTLDQFPQEDVPDANSHPLLPSSASPEKAKAFYDAAIRVKENGQIDKSMSDWVFARMCLCTGLTESETAAALLEFPHGKAAARGEKYLTNTVRFARESILLAEDCWFGA